MHVRGPFDVVVDGVSVHYKLYDLSSKGTSKHKLVCCTDFDANDPLPEKKWKGFGIPQDDDETIGARIR